MDPSSWRHCDSGAIGLDRHSRAVARISSGKPSGNPAELVTTTGEQHSQKDKEMSEANIGPMGADVCVYGFFISNVSRYELTGISTPAFVTPGVTAISVTE